MKIIDLIGTEHYVCIPKRVMAHPYLSQSAKLLYGELLDFCLRFDSKRVYPSQASLGQAIGVSSRQHILKLTQELVEAGFAKVEYERVGGRRRLVYWLRSATVNSSLGAVEGTGQDNKTQRRHDNKTQHESDQKESDQKESDPANAELGAASDQAATPSRGRRRASDAPPGAWPPLIHGLYNESTFGPWDDLKPWQRQKLAKVTDGLSGEDGTAIIREIISCCAAAIDRGHDSEGKPIKDPVLYLITALGAGAY